MPRFAANLTWLYTELPFLDRFAAAATSGFRGVECMFPYEFAAHDVAARLRDHGLAQVLINLPAGNWAAGERGIAADPARRREFQEGVRIARDYCGAIGCTTVNCLVGIATGIEPQRARDTLVENLGAAAGELASAGIRLLIEPINTRDIPGFYLNRTGQAVDIIEAAGSPNLFLQYDIYHMQIMEGDLARTLEAQLPRIAHVQLADNPGRNEPGTGEIHYPFLFDLLDRIGYSGWIGCEYKPRRATTESLGWFAPYARTSGRE